MIENEILNPEIGNPNFEAIYENLDYKKGKKIIDKNLEKLFSSIVLENPIKGSVIRSTYKGILSDQYVFETGLYKDDIRIDVKPSETKYLKNCEIGDEVDVLIVNVNHQHYFIKGSISSLYESMAHENIKSLEDGESVTVYVKSLNPAGYDVEIMNGGVTVPGFMPNTLAGINKLYNPESIVGETFEVMIESSAEMNPKFENECTYIVSRRKYLQTLIPDAISSLEFNKLYVGNVTGTTSFGIFVEFDECLTGMIHKANVTPEWQDRIDEIKPGQAIEFYIKEIIKNKIILTQVLRETLWDTIENGQVLNGVVRDVKQFGALITLDDETVGLIKTSELEKTKRGLSKGQEINVKVIDFDRSDRKIFLTLSK